MGIADLNGTKNPSRGCMDVTAIGEQQWGLGQGMTDFGTLNLMAIG